MLLSLLLASFPSFQVEKMQMGMRVLCVVETSASGSKAAMRRSEHQAFAEKLYQDGKLEIEGPVQDSRKISIMVFKTEKPDEAKDLLKGDVALTSGDCTATYYQWYFPVSAIKAAPSSDAREKTWFGTLTRSNPPKPKLSDDEEKKLQDGHMANINAMAKTGDLVLAGPLDGDQPFLGVFIFRTDDPRHIGDLVRNDPKIASGRLTLHLYRWSVPKGILPTKL